MLVEKSAEIGEVAVADVAPRLVEPLGPGQPRPVPLLDMEERELGQPLDGKGEIKAELDIKPDLWFFDCHFEGDPVMPGCLGLDAMWQLVGFYLCWLDLPGKGRALGAGKVKFTGQVLPHAKLVTYQIDIKRVITRKLNMAIADATMSVDGREIYTAEDLRVGLFTSSDDF